jgi:hypothetical protein
VLHKQKARRVGRASRNLGSGNQRERFVGARLVAARLLAFFVPAFALAFGFAAAFDVRFAVAILASSSRCRSARREKNHMAESCATKNPARWPGELRRIEASSIVQISSSDVIRRG